MLILSLISLTSLISAFAIESTGATRSVRNLIEGFEIKPASVTEKHKFTGPSEEFTKKASLVGKTVEERKEAAALAQKQIKEQQALQSQLSVAKEIPELPISTKASEISPEGVNIKTDAVVPIESVTKAEVAPNAVPRTTWEWMMGKKGPSTEVSAAPPKSISEKAWDWHQWMVGKII